jgi:dCTP deaminase
MILTGPAIRAALKAGKVVLDPFDRSQVNPNSYNYHLGRHLAVSCPQTGRIQRVVIPASGYVLRPGVVYLGSTLERIGSKSYVTLLLGRSSVGRLGIFLNVTADLGHVGSCSHWTLELTAVQPVRIYPGMTIGQVSFWCTAARSQVKYRGRYHRDVRPVPNRDRNLSRLRT